VGTVLPIFLSANFPTIHFNEYYDGTSKYFTTGFAAQLYHENTGDLIYTNAPSGTAGNTPTLTRRFIIATGGNVEIGANTPLALLSVDGVSSGGPSTTDKGIGYFNAFNNAVGVNFGNYTASPFACWIQSMDQRSGQATTYPLVLNPIGSGVGIGMTAPTASLHLPAGTATANTAPAKLTAGTLLATPEIGAIEFTDDGTTAHLYCTVRVATVVTRVQVV
jgi:hypothetical protein